MDNLSAMPELLAPAGGMAQLEAAIYYGADAVYGGMDKYGLRAFAGNFNFIELKQAIDLCHKYNKKFYVTLNSYPRDNDLEGFCDYAGKAYDMGADAVIVSDIGAASLIHERINNLEIHISTQANILNSKTAKIYFELGAKRIILARELSLEDIKRLRENLKEELAKGLELEAFVHGAMCMSYSGRCIMSNFLAGRGANQGACAQPCRWQYYVMEQKRPGEYMPVYQDENGTSVFSAQDLNVIGILPELVQSGLTSLKIEGRMKTEYYVATVVSAYRRGLDALGKGPDAFNSILPELREELNKTSHRPGNTGFYMGSPMPCAGAEGFSQTMEYVAKIIEDKKAGEKVRAILKNRFYAGDCLEVMQPGGFKGYIPNEIYLASTNEKVLSHGIAGDELLLVFDFDVKSGDIIRGPARNHDSK